jgi:hypothetical protein
MEAIAVTAIPAESGSPKVILRTFPVLPAEERRRRDAARHRVYRARRQTKRAGGVVLEELHLNAAILYGLRRLGLVGADERDPETIAGAVCYLLQNVSCELARILERLTPDER